MVVKSQLKLAYCNYQLYKGMVSPDNHVFILGIGLKQQRTHTFLVYSIQYMSHNMIIAYCT